MTGCKKTVRFLLLVHNPPVCSLIHLTLVVFSSDAALITLNERRLILATSASDRGRVGRGVGAALSEERKLALWVIYSTCHRVPKRERFFFQGYLQKAD
jgi:hypothetical protein